MKAPRTIHGHQHHFGWDRSRPPVLTVAPGDLIRIETVDSSGGQIGPTTTAADIPGMDASRYCPLCGPVCIDGVEPGDAVLVTVEDLHPTGTGWTAIMPPFGLLIDDFPDPALHRWAYNSVSLTPAAFGAYARVPLRPFIGTIGLATAEPGWHSAIPPRRVGGNMDVRDIVRGSRLYLPAEVAGGLLSLGDTHAAQGDGEVCGTALESRLDVVIRVDVVKGGAPAFPRLETPPPVYHPRELTRHDITTGIGPDLMENARNAVRCMIDLLSRRHGMPPEQAYMLCSVAGHLRISDIVDMPNWVVSFHMPQGIFD